MDSKVFGKMPDGREARLYTLANANGMRVVFSDLGGIITNIWLPGRDGDVDVVLGHYDISGYVADDMRAGALIGRNSNRIAEARFTLDGREYQLEQNNGRHNLHGGTGGLASRMFSVQGGDMSAHLSACIPNMEDGFPGKLDVSVCYTLSDDNALTMGYRASSDSSTLINLTNHSYFNLGGHAGHGVGEHVLTLHAPFYAPNTPESIPTGELLAVSGTPFDFRQGAQIEHALQSDHPQIELFGGLDHSFLFPGEGIRRVATLVEPKSGRSMEVRTTLPAMQIYTANSIPDGQRGKHGLRYAPHQGVCFETQLVPNAVNMPWLRTPVYEANREYNEATSFIFSW